ncbi:MAG TPA: hypothetical protein VK071_00105 [Tissierellales bacterium]|nr:hypothetical protein [Tissierellales bacterium]
MSIGMFTFRKEVSLNDITELVITRKPLIRFKEKFKSLDAKETVSSKEQIRSLIEEYSDIGVYL